MGVGLNGLHEVEADLVQNGNIGDASLVDGTGGDIGSSSRQANAEGPASLGNLLSTLLSALPQLVLTSRGSLALLVLVGTLSLDALQERGGLGEHQGEDEAQDNEKFHWFGI